MTRVRSGRADERPSPRQAGSNQGRSQHDPHRRRKPKGSRDGGPVEAELPRCRSHRRDHTGRDGATAYLRPQSLGAADDAAGARTHITTRHRNHQSGAKRRQPDNGLVRGSNLEETTIDEVAPASNCRQAAESSPRPIRRPRQFILGGAFPCIAPVPGRPGRERHARETVRASTRASVRPRYRGRVPGRPGARGA